VVKGGGLGDRGGGRGWVREGGLGRKRSWERGG
jgi:hypothetical protein